MFFSFLLALLLQKELSGSNPCLSLDESGTLCYLCSAEYYLSARGISSPFPVELCKKKLNEGFRYKILVTKQAVNLTTEFNSTSPDFLVSFLDTSFMQSKYVKSEVYFFFAVDIKTAFVQKLSSNLRDLSNITFGSLVISPLFCNETNIPGVCYEDPQSKINIYFKTSTFSIHLSGSLKLRSTVLDASDAILEFSGSSACWLEKKLCCDRNNQSLQALPPYCNPDNVRTMVDYINPGESLFIFESQQLYSNEKFIEILDTQFSNFFLKFQGSAAVFSVKYAQNFSIKIENSLFSNLLLSGSVLHVFPEDSEAFSGTVSAEIYLNNVTVDQIKAESRYRESKIEGFCKLVLKFKTTSKFTFSNLSILRANTSYWTFIYTTRSPEARDAAIYLTNISLTLSTITSFMRAELVQIVAIRNFFLRDLSVFDDLAYSDLVFLNGSLVSVYGISIVNCSFSQPEGFIAGVRITGNISSVTVLNSSGGPVYLQDSLVSISDLFSVNSKIHFSALEILSSNITIRAVFILNLSFIAEVSQFFYAKTSWVSIFSTSILTSYKCHFIFFFKDARLVSSQNILILNIKDNLAIYNPGTAFALFSLTDSVFLNNCIFSLLRSISGLYGPKNSIFFVKNLAIINNSVINDVSDYFLVIRFCTVMIFNSHFLDLIKIIKKDSKLINSLNLVRDTNFFMLNCSVINNGFSNILNTSNVGDFSIWMVISNIETDIESSIFMNSPNSLMRPGFFTVSTVYHIRFVNNVFMAFNDDKKNKFFKGLIIQKFVLFIFSMNFASNLNCPRMNFLNYGSFTVLGEGGLYDVSFNNTFSFTNNFLELCQCDMAGALLISSVDTLLIENNFFSKHSGYKGSCISIFSTNYVHLKANFFRHLLEGSIGSAIFLSFINKCYIYSLHIEYAVSELLGPIYLEQVDYGFFLGINASHIKSNDSGGLLYTLESNIQIRNSTFFNVSCLNLGGLFFLDSLVNIELSNLQVSVASAAQGALIYIVSATNVFIRNSSLSFITASDSGALAVINVISVFRLEGLMAYKIHSSKFGAFHIRSEDESSVIDINGLIITNLSSSQYPCGCLVHFTSLATFKMTNISIYFASCYHIFDIKWEAKKEFFLSAALFDSLLCFNLLNIFGMNLTASEILVQNSNFDSKFFNIKNARVNFSKIVLVKNCFNFSIIKAFLIFMNDLPIIQTKNSELICSKVYFLASRGNVFLFAENSIVNLEVVYIQEPWSITNGVIYLVKCRVKAQGLIFIAASGSSFSTTESQKEIINSLFLLNQYSYNFLHDIVFQDQFLAQSYLLLENVTFIRNNVRNIILVKNIEKVIIRQCSFSSTSAEMDALRFFNVLNFSLADVYFHNFSTSRPGPAIFLARSDYFDLLFSLVIENCSFSNNTSLMYGGSLFITDIDQIIVKDCRFHNNSASSNNSDKEGTADGFGGCAVIYISGVMYAMYKDCKIVLTNNIFINNFASLYAPTIFSTFYMLAENNYYDHNADGINFTNKSSFAPLKLKLYFPNLDVKIEFTVEGFGSADYNEAAHSSDVIIPYQSGKAIWLTFILSDSLGQTLNFDNFSTISIETKSFSNSISEISNSVGKLVQGKLNLGNLTIKSYNLNPEPFELNVFIPKDLIFNENNIREKFILTFQSQNCLIGQVRLLDYSCLTCPPGTYSFFNHSLSKAQTFQRCTPCPSTAICKGGALVSPKAGSWLKPNASELTIINCFIVDACVNSDVESCREGHFGNLCHDCLRGYGKQTLTNLCEHCKQWTTVIRFVLSHLFIVLYLMFISYTYTLHEEKGEYWECLVAMKIVTNYMQIIFIIIFFNYKSIIPDIDAFYSITNSIMIATEDLLFNDCLIQSITDYINEVYLYKVLLIVLLPLGYVLLLALIWIVNHFFKARRAAKQGKELSFLSKISEMMAIRIFASIVATLFLLHPMITKACFNLLNCISFESDKIYEEQSKSENFLMVSPNFQCWTEYHYYFVKAVAVPGILIWSFGFPVLLMWLLTLQHGKINAYSSPRIAFRFKTLQEKKPASKSNKNAQRKTANNEIVLNKINGDLVVLSSNDQLKKPTRIILPKVAKKVKSKDPLSTNTSAKDTEFAEKGKTSRRDSLLEAIVESNVLGFLQFGYKNEYLYWEGIIFFKKLLITLNINLVMIFGFRLVVLLVLSILFLHLCIQLSFRPFQIEELNKLEEASLFITINIFVQVVLLTEDLGDKAVFVISISVILHYCYFLVKGFYFIIMALYKMKAHKRILEYLKKRCLKRK